MTTFVALLRGVNVGKARRIPMAEFRDLLSGLSYTGVRTLLNSGNAVFSTTKGSPAKHAANIAAAISDHFQFDVPVIVKSAKELAAIISENPIPPETDQHSRFLVTFVQNSKALSRLAAIQSYVEPPEQFAIGTNAAYILCAAGILNSKAGKALLDTAGQSVTSRNWATVLKLHALANESAT